MVDIPDYQVISLIASASVMKSIIPLSHYWQLDDAGKNWNSTKSANKWIVMNSFFGKWYGDDIISRDKNNSAKSSAITW